MKMHRVFIVTLAVRLAEVKGWRRTRLAHDAIAQLEDAVEGPHIPALLGWFLAAAAATASARTLFLRGPWTHELGNSKPRPSSPGWAPTSAPPATFRRTLNFVMRNRQLVHSAGVKAWREFDVANNFMSKKQKKRKKGWSFKQKEKKQFTGFRLDFNIF